jgi:hypothetical protein
MIEAHNQEELDGPGVSAFRRTIAEVKQRYSVTKNVLSRALSFFERHVKPLVLAVFSVVSTYSSSKEG